MTEKRIMITGTEYPLEARYEPGNNSNLVVICHPHPLYGGSMENNVVEALRGSFCEQNWATLRFNFRGVGSSGGHYSEGIGETDDLVTVWRRFADEVPGQRCLAGYSFGAWIALKACRHDCQPDLLVLVSPPVNLLDFSNLRLPGVPCLVVSGDRDLFCETDVLRQWLAGQNADEKPIEWVTITNCDHFYWGCEISLRSEVHRFVAARTKNS